MKKPSIQKRISLAQKKMDRQMQLENVPLNPQCLVCGSQTAEMHHYVQKTMSAYLRYEKRNLVPLCKNCHTRHHLSGDPTIVATIARKKGKTWQKWIQDHRYILVKKDKFYLQELEKKLTP